MKPKVICAGHVCIDITPVFSQQTSYQKITDILEPGKLIHMNNVQINTGGSVANTGLAMKLLGNDVRLMGKTGNDAFGHMIRDIFNSYGAGGLIEENEAVTSYTVVLAIPGIDRIFLHDPGANDTFSCADIPWSEIDGTALFHFGYPPLMKQMYADNGAELVKMFREIKVRGIASSLDMAAIDPQSPAGKADWPLILEKTLPYIDFFVPSFEELCWILDRETWQKLNESGTDITDGLDLAAYAKPLAEKCISMGCAAVLIKCGTSGLYYKTAGPERIAAIGKNLKADHSKWTDQEGIQPCFEAEIVRSGTGAGDLSIAAFLSGVLRGDTPQKCAELAAAEGAASVTSYDTLGGLLQLEELNRRIEAGWKKREIISC